MNNKGQVLVIFVLLIPIFLFIFAIVIDVGMLYVEDKHAESSIKETIKYGLENIESVDLEESMNNLITKNINNVIEANIKIENDYIYITVRNKYNGIFKSLITKNIYELSNSYYGYIEDNNFVINKE